jgi:RNA polymerase sigma-70 factor (ECF subfamily)
MNPFRLFIPVTPAAGCAAFVGDAVQPDAAAGSITSGMSEPVEQLLRERRYDRALERLLDEHRHKVFRMALVMLRDTAKAEDVTQDVFIKLWRALPLYDGRAAVSTWLYTIARNTCLSAIRADNYRRTSALDEAVEPSAPSTTQLTLSVEQCLSRLPDVQRQVTTLFYMQERSVADVAAMLDLPEGTVKSHLHRARRALAVMMAPAGQSSAAEEGSAAAGTSPARART